MIIRRLMPTMRESTGSENTPYVSFLKIGMRHRTTIRIFQPSVVLIFLEQETEK